MTEIVPIRRKTVSNQSILDDDENVKNDEETHRTNFFYQQSSVWPLSQVSKKGFYSIIIVIRC